MLRTNWTSRCSAMVLGVALGTAIPIRAGTAQARAPWATDPRTGCTASLRDVELDNWGYSGRRVLTWTGACKDGKADGYGTLTIWDDSMFSDRAFVSRMEITPESGLRMNEGLLNVSLDPSELRIEVARKTVTPFGALVAIYRIRKTQDDYRYRATIMAMGRYLREARPSLNLPNINIDACVKDEGDAEQPPQSPISGGFRECAARLSLRKDQEDPVNAWSDAERAFQGAARRLVEDSFRVVRAARAAAAQQAAAAAQESVARVARAHEEQRVQHLDSLRNQFAKKYGVQGFVDVNQLATNPFNFEGKIVGVVVSFREMVTATTGVLGQGVSGPQILVSRIPRGTFKGGEMLVLAGRVLGKAPVKTPLGEVSLPHLSFVGMQLCENEWRECYLWLTRR